MPETILVIEYEPRYTDRVQQALSGQPFTPSFARDGDEAMRAIQAEKPRLIVMSSVVPKTTTADLIRAIRSQAVLQNTPILLTVSGYAGTTPQADAQRIGASDILPKPYSDAEFLGKVQQLLGASAPRGAVQPNSEYVVRPTARAEAGHLTSDDIFSDVLEEERTVVTPPRKAAKQASTGDVDKMIADKLAGMMPQKKTAPGLPKPPTMPGTTPTPRPRTEPGSAELDKILHDTLSGIDRSGSARTKSAPPAVAPAPATTAAPPAPPRQQSAPPAAAPVAPQRPAAATPAAAPPQPPQRAAVPQAKPAAVAAAEPMENIAVAQPVFPPPAAERTAPAPPPVEEEEPADGVKFGQYVLLEKIATGGMAEVWKARMRGVEGFQKTVAIKKILPHLSDNQDFIEMFIDEAKLAAQLTHNNIIHIYDLGKIQSSYYIAMEYVDGWDLKTILRKAQDHNQPMTVELALFVASKIASALDYAHRRRDFDGKDLGLVHRDVSPQNVLISQEGDIKLCDFGIAKAASKASHTQNGALKGKLQYMSPEQAWGQSIDRRSDIFALATVLFEMLTGKKLFTGDSELSILEQVREARITPPSQINDEVTPEIDAVVLKALQKDPASRYQTAGDFARDIDQILYSMRPTPTSADLAIFMHRISVPEPVMPGEPDLEDTVIAPVTPAAPVAATPAAVPSAPPLAAREAPPVARSPFADAAEPPKKSKAVPFAVAAVIVIAIAAGAFFFLRGRSGSTSQPAPATSTAPLLPAPVAAASDTTAVATAAPATTTDTTIATTSSSPSIDPAKVEEEVRKRIEAERTKLDQIARAQQRPVTQTQPAPAVAAPPRPAATQTVAPPPVQATETRAPQTVTTATEAAQAPAPAPAPVEPPRAREGDMVTTSEGLTPPRVVRKTAPMYPPIARSQHIEGTVIVSALISETGQVLSTRIVSGLARSFGINEAAEKVVHQWTFAPAMKDGVHVKAWTTVRIDFKL